MLSIYIAKDMTQYIVDGKFFVIIEHLIIDC